MIQLLRLKYVNVQSKGKEIDRIEIAGQCSITVWVLCPLLSVKKVIPQEGNPVFQGDIQAP